MNSRNLKAFEFKLREDRVCLCELAETIDVSLATTVETVN